MAVDAAERKLAACCISHEFYKAALKHPHKIAVIHASGFARTTVDSLDGDRRSRDGCSKLTASSSRPPVYEGDECFTFYAINSAVEKLSCRLWRILHGADDPYMFKTELVNDFRDNSEHVAKSLQYSSPSVQHSSKFRKSRIPKVVGIYMEPSIDYIVAVLSVLRCGESFMPLDPSWPKSRILSVISSTKADLVVGIELSSEGNCCHKIDNLKWLIDDGSCPVLRFSMNETIKEQSESLLLRWPCESESLRSFCYLMCTSGSSGKPKGVCGTETGLLNRFSWMQEMYPLHEGDVVLFKTAVGFIDHMQEFLGALLSTCTLVIPPFNQLKENVYSVVDFLQGYFINRLVAVPSLMRAVLPALQSPHSLTIQGSLKLLILSGEVLHLPLCKMLLELLPRTSILNLYGSTEVTGDCTYFDCTRLPQILEKEVLSSVPIGSPVSNCDVVLVGEEVAYQGEIYVGGLCVAAGYFDYPHLIPLTDGDVSPEHDTDSPNSGCRFQHYFRTGDFARRLPSGDLVFLGRKDRTVKVNGQRVALEEIEGAFREHPNVVDAAVLSREVGDEILFIEAHVVREETFREEELLKSSLRNWVLRKLPHVMIPSRIFFTRSLPLTPSGKVDYLSLTASDEEGAFNVEDIHQDHLIEVIKKVFSDALMVKKVSVDDDFFEMGGNSLSAAYASFKLGIHMKLLYTFPTPSKLQMALSSSGSSLGTDSFLGVNRTKSETAPSSESSMGDLHGSKPQGVLFEANSNRDFHMAKKLKFEPNNCTGHSEPTCGGILWNPNAVHTECSFSRCNKSTHIGKCEKSYSGVVWSNIIPRDGKGFMQELWKVDLGSCVDASPLVVCKGSDIYLFIGSHSHKFFCINGRSGVVQWESKLEGRVECSATILDDLSQVVVGCYEGYIYFLQFSNGNICWRFRTDGEVKSQPVVDKCRHLVWCGSYDHNLYAIDYKSYCCIYKLLCGGSIFGSPAINEMQESLYVASTNGHVTALEIKTLPFKTLWKQDMGAPAFASLSINYSDGNIICCLVDGTVNVLSCRGSIIWKVRTGGPIFAGPCTSRALPSQVLICSRDGIIYSFEMETGNLIWKHTVGHPVTSSAYVDEFSLLKSDNNPSSPDRLMVCVCDSSGSIHVLRVFPNAAGGGNNTDEVVHEFARLDLNGDIFSSPVMIGGRIFVGCRDDHVYNIQLDVELA
ncbi:Putative acyl-activating enzyme 19 [Striga hermonthica]|uniref:Acyl-activating enzyme 19 n=1 Tax=Striga hermonthica TaxID=68872 RepID=A0A9N7RS74_STRHE|nr:Putative acyl-activating enzyme 19 [Striga hermonthica]